MTARVVALVVVWVALWGEVSVANVASGLTVAVLLGVVFPSAAPPNHRAAHRVRPLAALRLAAYVASSLVTSTWHVVVAVLAPTPDRIHAEIVPVALTTRSPLVASLVANAITLTPGTMSIECDPDSFVLHIHVLGRTSFDDFRAQVLQLEQLVVAALPERSSR
jgi:multicomponent Na+:H+ antiporter subunit E